MRLTFKLENDQLWLSTKERTEKLPMGSIKSIVSEPIEGHEEYHIMVGVFFAGEIFNCFWGGGCFRAFSWDQRRRLGIGFIGCRRSMWTL